MKNIVVPTDFSVKSLNALELAKKIANKTDGIIYIVHVIEPVSGQYSSIGENLENNFDDIYMIELMKRVKKEISILKNAHLDQSSKIKTEIFIGDPYNEIKEFVKLIDADLIIMGSQGSNSSDEFFIGSLVDKIIRSITCPVITVKELITNNKIQNIVFATDPDEENASMIIKLKKLQELFDSYLHIVRINTRKNFKNDIDTMVRLRYLADKYQLKKFTLTSYSHEDEEYGVVYFADEKQADLIAIVIHEQSGFRRLISGGSLAEEITDHTQRPVLTFQLKSE